MRVIRNVLEQTALPLTIVILWEVGARQGWISTFFFSSPLEIARVVGNWFSKSLVFGNLATTLTEAGVGYLIGTTIGTALGLLFPFLLG